MGPKTTSSQPRAQDIKSNPRQNSQASWPRDFVAHDANFQQIFPPPSLGTRRKKKKSWHFLFAFFALAVVAFTSALDATSLSVALPVCNPFEENTKTSYKLTNPNQIVARDLNGSSLGSFWAGISFLLTSVLFQPLSTSCSDIFGRKPVLYICIGVFGLGAIVFGTARSMNSLIIGRAIQGIGGGGLEALSEIILTDMTTLKERALWTGVLGFVWAAGSVMGPLLGAVFSEYASWRWIGWINLPLLAVAIVLIPSFLTLQTIKLSTKAKIRQLDWLGFFLFIVGLTSFILGITMGGVLYPWTSWRILFPIVLGLLVLIAFFTYESKPVEPIIPYRVLQNRTGIIALLAALLHGLILFGVLFYIPIYFEGVIGDKPLRGSVEALALSLTVTPLAIITAFAIGHVRRYCWAVSIGWALTTAGMGLLSLLTPSSSQVARTSLQTVAGLGLGMLFPALSIPMQASVNVDDNGLAIGTFVFARQLGAVFGLVLGSAIFTNLFTRELPQSLPDELSALRDSETAESFITRLRSFNIQPFELEPVLLTYSNALHGVWYALAAVGGVAFLMTLLMKDISLENESTGKQVFKRREDDAVELLNVDNEISHQNEIGLIVIPPRSVAKKPEPASMIIPSSSVVRKPTPVLAPGDIALHS